MRLVTASVAAVFMLGAGGAMACEWQVTASAAVTPAPVAEAPATAIDPVMLAQLERAAILPAAPKEETAAN